MHLASIRRRFKNVIASSGTAFTEPQARLLGRFSKNIVVNFDPDTAGAAAAERSLTLLVSEDFQIKVLTLESGFDPDLYIRRQGQGRLFRGAAPFSTSYFDYLIERARAQFPSRTPEGKVKAVNYLLPHVQRVPSRIARDELANEISHRLGIDSAVAATGVAARSDRDRPRGCNRRGSGLTDAERVLIRALASRDYAHAPLSQREGQDLGLRARAPGAFCATRERLHEGSAAGELIDALLVGAEQGPDPMSLPLEESRRSLLASILMDEQEELDPGVAGERLAVAAPASA